MKPQLVLNWLLWVGMVLAVGVAVATDGAVERAALIVWGNFFIALTSNWFFTWREGRR